MTDRPRGKDLADNWLDAVDRVLRADTGDLRELAVIGGADPRTLYIGTRLDGVDIRGQDLRGMIFSDLDPAKVEMDSATLVDPRSTAVVERDDRAPTALIYFQDEVSWREASHSAETQLRTAQLFGPDDRAAFLAEVADYAGPKLVIAELPREGKLRPPNRPFDADVLVILSRKRRDLLLSEDDRDFIRAFGRPVILTPIQTEAPLPRGAPGLAGGVRALISLCLVQWSEVQAASKQYRVAGFLRAREGPRHAVGSVWLQLYSRATVLGLNRTTGVRFDLQSRTDLEYGRLLFRHLPRIPGGANRFLHAALILDLGLSSPDVAGPAYDNVVSTLLNKAGWAVERLELSDPETMQVSGAVGDLTIRASPADPAPGRRELEPVDIASALAVMPTSIVVTEPTDAATVSQGLAARRELYVSIRDLADFSIGEPSLWSVLAVQMRRLARTTNAVERTQYLSMFLWAALDRGSAAPPRLRELMAAGQAQYPYGYRLDLREVRAPAKEIGCGLVLYETVDDWETEAAHFSLMIDASGPSILWDEDEGGVGQSAR